MHRQSLASRREDILSNLATNLRHLRREQGLSQARLALDAGVSRRMLAAIEGGETNVSLSVVDRLAAGLGVRFTQLVRAPEAGDSRHIGALAWRGKTPHSRAELLGAAPGSRETELWLWSLGPGERYPSEDNSGDWYEILFVLEGILRVEFAHAEQFVHADDFLIFSCAERYVFVNAGKATLRYIRNVVL